MPARLLGGMAPTPGLGAAVVRGGGAQRGTEATRSDSASRTLRLGPGPEAVSSNGGRASRAQLPDPAGRVGQPGESDLGDSIGRGDAHLQAAARADATPSTGVRTDPYVPSNGKLILPLSLPESAEYPPKPLELRLKCAPKIESPHLFLRRRHRFPPNQEGSLLT